MRTTFILSLLGCYTQVTLKKIWKIKILTLEYTQLGTREEQKVNKYNRKVIYFKRRGSE